MKLYVGGKWQDRDRIKEIQTILSSLGHSMTVDWTKHDFGPNGVLASAEDLKNIAYEDYLGVKMAEAVIFIFEKKYDYKGAFVEMGIAIGLDKPVFVIGNAGDSCIFINYPSVLRFNNLENFLKYKLESDVRYLWKNFKPSWKK